MLDWIKEPWPWYVSGPLIGLMVPLLLIFGNKAFGISSSLRHICAICVPMNIKYFNYDWRGEMWNLFFAAGIILGGFIAHEYMTNNEQIAISEATVESLKQRGITDFSSYVPVEIFNWGDLFTLKGFVFIVLGGFLVGFGTRYANGCTSGHSISGLSNLQLASLVATISFFIGGLIMTHFVLPYIL